MKITASWLKKLSVSALLLSAGSVSMLSHAAVTLLVDDHIKVTAVNGQEIKQSAFQPSSKTFTLQPGQHVITAKYDRLYNLPRDEHDYLRSGNISVTADMADNQTYRLTMLGQPEDYRAAKEYAERPTLAVQQNNMIIARQQSMAGNDGGLFSGIGKALGGVFGGGGDAKSQNQRAIAALGQPATTTQGGVDQRALNQGALNQGAPNQGTISAVTVATVKQPTSVSSSANTLDQFMQLWLNATPAEREKIRQWTQK